jgi:exodeoxyribonuclease III
MRILSYNVNGIRASAKKGLPYFLESDSPDIIGFQETKATPDQVRETMFGINDYRVFANGAEKPGYSGTAIATRIEPKSVGFGIGVPEHDREGRVVTAEFEWFYLVNVYTPNSSEALVRLPYRQEWDRAFREYVTQLKSKKSVIICGDLNVAHRPVDIARPEANYNKTSGYTQAEIDGLDALLGAGFKDTFRTLHPDTVAYSWWSFRAGARAKNIGWRIDYFLVSDDLISKVKCAFIMPEIDFSDHCPVGIELSF